MFVLINWFKSTSDLLQSSLSFISHMNAQPSQSNSLADSTDATLSWGAHVLRNSFVPVLRKYECTG